jgi:hypothetical protein
VLCHEDAVEFGKVGWDIGEDCLERVPSGSVRPQASRIGPKRNRWRDLQAVDDQLVEIELRRDGISRQVNELSASSANEPERHAQELASWYENNQQGERPESRAAILEQQIGDLRAEYAAVGVRRRRLWGE